MSNIQLSDLSAWRIEAESRKVCDSCETELIPDHSAFAEGDLRYLCDECFTDLTFECCNCGEPEFKTLQKNPGYLIGIFDSCEAGHPQGTYRVIEHPWYMCGVVGGGMLFKSALELVTRAVPDTRGDADWYAIGSYCARCAERMIKTKDAAIGTEQEAT